MGHGLRNTWIFSLEWTSHDNRSPDVETGRLPSRRTFLAASGGLALNFMIVPRHVLGGAGYLAPSERVNVGGIGAGGMGGGDIATVARLGANIVALCDVDTSARPARLPHFPGRGVTKTSGK